MNTAMFYKDIKIFFGDTGQWSQVFIIGTLIMIYVYNFKSIPINALSGFPFIKEIMVLVNLVLSGLVLSAVSARFIYASVSLEGQAFWIIRTSPVDMNRFIRSKVSLWIHSGDFAYAFPCISHKSRYEYQRNSGVSVAWNSPYALHLCERARLQDLAQYIQSSNTRTLLLYP